VYEEAECNLFVHHDFEVPAFPLCMSWMDLDPRNRDNKGSFIAVGTFLPGIEIWNLDVIDVLEPVATLGGYDTQAGMHACCFSGLFCILMIRILQRWRHRRRRARKPNRPFSLVPIPTPC
jgi:hypothetical protein